MKTPVQVSLGTSAPLKGHLMFQPVKHDFFKWMTVKRKTSLVCECAVLVGQQRASVLQPAIIDQYPLLLEVLR